jgi:hypothetical protein
VPPMSLICSLGSDNLPGLVRKDSRQNVIDPQLRQAVALAISMGQAGITRRFWSGEDFSRRT